MMLQVSLLLTVVCLSSCESVPPAPHDVRVNSLTYGLWHECGSGCLAVYEAGEEFELRSNGKIYVAGKSWEPCMWYGFTIKYQSTDEITRLNCTSTFSAPMKLVNVKEVVGEGLQSFDWKIDLKGRIGTYTHSEYTVTAEDEMGTEQTTTDTTICKFKGIELFRYRFKIHEGRNQVLHPVMDSSQDLLPSTREPKR